MKIIISGRDRTQELGPAIKAEAAARVSDPQLPPLPEDIRATKLVEARDEAAFDEAYLRLVRIRSHVDTRKYVIPHRPGVVGHIQVLVRKFLWRLLRYQHDRFAFRQNLINSQLVSALEFERDETRSLAKRVAELERRSRT